MMVTSALLTLFATHSQATVRTLEDSLGLQQLRNSGEAPSSCELTPPEADETDGLSVEVGNTDTWCVPQ